MAKNKEVAPNVSISKSDILSGVLGDALKKYGNGVIRHDKESIDQKRYKNTCISTGSINLDALFGVGGLPYGKVIELRGDPSSFKTGLLMCIAAKAQKQGFFVIFSDNEHRFDPSRAEQLGMSVDPEKFLLITPNNGEESLTVIEAVIKSVDKVFIIIDSISSLLPQGDMKKAIDEGMGSLGSQARLISSGLKRLVGSISKSDSILAVTNQYRTVSAGMFMFKGVSGGYSLKYYDSYILEIKKWDKAKRLKDFEGNQIGQRIEVEAIKSSSNYPGRSKFIPIHLGFGIWRELEAFELGVELGTIEKNTSIYSFPEIDGKTKLELRKDDEENIVIMEKVKGKDNCIKYLEENKEYMEKLTKYIRKTIGVRE